MGVATLALRQPEAALAVITAPEAFAASFTDAALQSAYQQLRLDCELATIPALEPRQPHSVHHSAQPQTMEDLAATVARYPADVAETWKAVSAAGAAALASPPEDPVRLAWESVRGLGQTEQILAGLHRYIKRGDTADCKKRTLLCYTLLEAVVMPLVELVVLCLGGGPNALYGDYGTLKGEGAPHRNVEMPSYSGRDPTPAQFEAEQRPATTKQTAAARGGPVVPGGARSFEEQLRVARCGLHTDIIPSRLRSVEANDRAFFSATVPYLDRRLREALEFAASDCAHVGGAGHPDASIRSGSITGDRSWQHKSPEFPTTGAVVWRVFHGARCFFHRYDAAVLSAHNAYRDRSLAPMLPCDRIFFACVLWLRCLPHLDLNHNNALGNVNASLMEVAGEVMANHGYLPQMQNAAYFLQCVLPQDAEAEFRRQIRC